MQAVCRIGVAWLLAASQLACVIALPGGSGADAAQAPPSGEWVERYSAAELAAILRQEGYGSVSVDENGNLQFRANGMRYALYLYEDGDLQLYFGLTGVSIDPETLNEWNRTRRLSRAYLDQQRDVVLEADLLANAGITRTMVAEFVRVFLQSTALFQRFLLEHGEPLPADQADPAGQQARVAAPPRG